MEDLSESGGPQSRWHLVMVIVAIVGISYFAVSYIGLIPHNSQNKRVSRACDDLEAIDTAIAKFAMRAGRPPTGPEGLAALVARPPTLERQRGWARAMKAVPSDPWGNAYIYRASVTGTQTTTTIVSPGPDCVPNSEDDLETDPRTYTTHDISGGAD